MSKDCSIEFNSRLYPGFIDLHALSSDSGVSTFKMMLRLLQQVQHQTLMVKRLSIGKIVLQWWSFSLVLPGNAALKAALCIVSLKDGILCVRVYILKSQGPHLQSPLICRYHYVILNSIGLN